MSTFYNSRIIYSEMMRNFLEKKITALEYKNQFIIPVLDVENGELINIYYEELIPKLYNKELFDQKNADMLFALEEQINALEFARAFWSQRNKDVDEHRANEYRYDEDHKNLSENQKIFKEKYGQNLYDKAWSDECLDALALYEEGAQELNIQRDLFFDGIINFVEGYAREYFPGDSKYFDHSSVGNVNEETLYKIVRAAYNVLTRNKDKWDI